MKATDSHALIVTTSRDEADLLVFILNPAGYQTTLLQDFSAVQETVENIQPDIIILDAIEEIATVFLVCEQLKKISLTSDIPLIVIGSNGDTHEKVRALEAGAEGYIARPFDRAEVLCVLKSQIRRKQECDHLRKTIKFLNSENDRLQQETILKKELAAIISHDMKNPLFIIQGCLQMMEMFSESNSAGENEKHLSKIDRSCRTLQRMIVNLEAINALEEENLKVEAVPVSLKDTLDHLIDFLNDQSREDEGSLQHDISADLPRIHLDHHLLDSVLEVILNFFIKNTLEDFAVKISAHQLQDRLQLHMYHEGIQVPERFHQQIFLKTAQAELKKAGFKPAGALGLIFCKLALQANKSDVYIESSVSTGTKFVLDFPIWKDELVGNAEKANSNGKV